MSGGSPGARDRILGDHGRGRSLRGGEPAHDRPL